MTRTQVYIPDDQMIDVELMTLMGYGNFSELVREGLTEVAKKKLKPKANKKFDPWRDFIGKGPKGGPKDLSKNIDYYLYVEPYEDKNK